MDCNQHLKINDPTGDILVHYIDGFHVGDYVAVVGVLDYDDDLGFVLKPDGIIKRLGVEQEIVWIQDVIKIHSSVYNLV